MYFLTKKITTFIIVPKAISTNCVTQFFNQFLTVNRRILLLAARVLITKGFFMLYRNERVGQCFQFMLWGKVSVVSMVAIFDTKARISTRKFS